MQDQDEAEEEAAIRELLNWERTRCHFRPYLDAIEAKTGQTPDELLGVAADRGYGPDTKPAVVVDWLKSDYGVGRGHAMAFVHVLRNGPTISDKHVGTSGTHRDESNTLRLDGVAQRQRT